MTGSGLIGSRVRVVKRKHPAAVRQTYGAVVLGRDNWGEWLHVAEEDAVLLMAPGCWWVAWFRLNGTVRIDIATAVTTHTSDRTFTDLDLDLERDVDGSVHLLDEDSFRERSPRYPVEWVQVAWDTWVELAEQVHQRVEPFDLAAEKWLVPLR